ncbi:MAG: nuclear transport factor 2 family protein [Myxococcaceae bacterium]|nr:nuclear transport factor 2 family protein [Myxococcaceae bacterium]
MMKQAMGLCAALLVCTAGAATARESKQAKSVSQKDRTELEALAQKYQRAFNQADADALAKLYTADGSRMDAMGDVARGPAAIRSQFQQNFQDMLRGAQVNLTVTDILPIDDRAAMIDCRFQVTGAQQAHANGPGRAVVIARREGNEWKLVSTRAFMTPPMQQGVGGAGTNDMGGARDEEPREPLRQPPDMNQPRGTMPEPPSSPQQRQ